VAVLPTVARALNDLRWKCRQDGDPYATRYGCFLPDLTGLAGRPSAACLRAPYRNRGASAQARPPSGVSPLLLGVFAGQRGAEAGLRN